ncbi:MAG: GNAT family N-acetyltransferase [Candidatus Dormibacteria bacterium]
MPILTGSAVVLRPVDAGDIMRLVAIRSTPEVFRRWGGSGDMAATVAGELSDPDDHSLVIEHDGMVVGAIQWSEESEPEYRHASLDIYLDPGYHNRGLGADAVRTLARYLLEGLGHHRLTIDPAADNAAAIRCYHKVGFREVGLMRQYERGPDGTWHDGLLMDLLAGELT